VAIVGVLLVALVAAYSGIAGASDLQSLPDIVASMSPSPSASPIEEPTVEPSASATPDESPPPAPDETAAPVDPAPEPSPTESTPTLTFGTADPSETALETPTIASDLADYSPGATVVLTGTGWTGDQLVRIKVDDNVGDWWFENDTVAVAADGTVYLDFQLPLWVVATYNVTATGVDTGRVATTTFTDAGDWTLDFIASEPSTYDHETGGGAYDDRTIGTDVVESLEGGDFKVGDTVTFLMYIKHDAGATGGAKTLELTHTFTLDTTGQSGLAFGPVLDVKVNYGPIYYTEGDATSGGIGDGAGFVDSGINDDRQTPTTGATLPVDGGLPDATPR